MGIQGCSMPDIMRISFLLCVLLLFSAPSLAEESDGAAMIAIQLAGFVTTHDVAEHSFIDKDIKDMSAEMAKKTQAGYDAALKIYQEGKNSRMQTKARTLDELWPGMHVNTQGHKATEEPFLKMYDEYEKITKHASAHKGAVAAMQGTDNAQELGINYATDKNAKTWPFRDQVAKKNIKYQVVMVYALHERDCCGRVHQEWRHRCCTALLGCVVGILCRKPGIWEWRWLLSICLGGKAQQILPNRHRHDWQWRHLQGQRHFVEGHHGNFKAHARCRQQRQNQKHYEVCAGSAQGAPYPGLHPTDTRRTQRLHSNRARVMTLSPATIPSMLARVSCGRFARECFPFCTKLTRPRLQHCLRQSTSRQWQTGIHNGRTSRLSLTEPL